MTAESGLVCVFSLKSPTHPERSAQLQAGVSSLDFHPEFWQLLAVGMHDGHVAVIDLTVRKDSDTFAVTNLITYRSSAMRGKRTVPITQVKLVKFIMKSHSISCLQLFFPPLVFSNFI
jgi:dynein intermediate chain 1